VYRFAHFSARAILRRNRMNWSKCTLIVADSQIECFASIETGAGVVLSHLLRKKQTRQTRLANRQ
jgi:hypothetical protein